VGKVSPWFSAVPVALSGGHKDHIARPYVVFVRFRGDNSLAIRHDQHLICGVMVQLVPPTIPKRDRRHPQEFPVRFSNHVLARHLADKDWLVAHLSLTTIQTYYAHLDLPLASLNVGLPPPPGYNRLMISPLHGLSQHCHLTPEEDTIDDPDDDDEETAASLPADLWF